MSHVVYRNKVLRFLNQSGIGCWSCTNQCPYRYPTYFLHDCAQHICLAADYLYNCATGFPQIDIKYWPCTSLVLNDIRYIHITHLLYSFWLSPPSRTQQIAPLWNKSSSRLPSNSSGLLSHCFQ